MNTRRFNRQLASGLAAWLAVAAAATWAQTTAPLAPAPEVPPTPIPAFTPPPRPLPGQINLRPSEPVVVERPSVAAPTVITSDELQMSLDKKVATFTGHVKVVDPQGTMIADKMVVHIGEEGKGNSVNKIEATGGVVISQEGRRAIADEAVYTAADRIVILSGAAQVQTGNSIVTGETIIYDMGKNTAVVKGKPRMTIPQGQRGGSGGLFPTVPRLPTPATGAATTPATP